MEISDKLFYEKVVIIRYASQSSKGIMFMTYQHFNKNEKKILKLLDDCRVNLEITIFTPDMEGELENEFKRVHATQTC